MAIQKDFGELTEYYENSALIAQEPRGLSWKVVQRLNTLYDIKEFFTDGNDRFDQLSNVGAIIAEYKAGNLGWNEGLVTYWKDGTQLCQPRPYAADECDIIYNYYECTQGFWVEGVSTSSRLSKYFLIVMF